MQSCTTCVERDRIGTRTLKELYYINGVSSKTRLPKVKHISKHTQNPAKTEGNSVWWKEEDSLLHACNTACVTWMPTFLNSDKEKTMYNCMLNKLSNRLV